MLPRLIASRNDVKHYKSSEKIRFEKIFINFAIFAKRDKMNTYYMIMAGMAAMAVVVFVALFFFKAGYGYLSNSKWGPKISNKVAWVLMEAPAFLFLLYYTVRFALSGADTGNSKVVLYVMAGLFLLHYFQRSFIFPLLMRGKSKMPVAVMLMGLVFNILNAYMIGGWLFEMAPSGMYTTAWFHSPQFIIGLLVFFFGMGILKPSASSIHAMLSS